MVIARPASTLPFEVVEEKYAYIFGRFALDPARRAGVPLRAVCLAQRKTGAKRGESPRLCGFDPAELQDLRYLAHAANAYPKLVALLQDVASHDSPRLAPLLRDLAEKSTALLRELGEVK